MVEKTQSEVENLLQGIDLNPVLIGIATPRQVGALARASLFVGPFAYGARWSWRRAFA